MSAGALVGSSWADFAVYGADGTQRYRSALGGGVELQSPAATATLCRRSEAQRTSLELTTGTPVESRHTARSA